MANLPSSPGQRRLPRGYTRLSGLQHDLKLWTKARLAKALVAIVTDQLQAIGVSTAMSMLLIERPWLWAIAALPSLIVIARAQRGLECMVHEASHHNIKRVTTRHRSERRIQSAARKGRPKLSSGVGGFARKSVNDHIGDLGAAFAVFSSVAGFRISHVPKHHKWFGSDEDPCMARYEKSRFHSLRRDTSRHFARDVAFAIPAYTHGWFLQISTSRRTLAKSVAWHCVVWSAVGLTVGPIVALVALAHWVTAFTVVLPGIRLVGEADEHDYTQPDERSATFTSLGCVQCLLFHPHGDGLHNEHHRLQNVPGVELRRFRTWLLAVDPSWVSAPTTRRIVRDRRSACS